MVGADEHFNVNEAVAAGVAAAAAVGDGGDVITFGDITEVYCDAFRCIGVGDGIRVATAVQGVAAGTAVQRVIAIVAVQRVAAGAACEYVGVVIPGQGVPVCGTEDVSNDWYLTLSPAAWPPLAVLMVLCVSSKSPVP